VEWPLIGRQSDLDHAVGLVESGTGIALLGTAGVGKSRFLHELGDRAERSGMALVRAVAARSTKAIPFAPFVELLRGGPTRDRLLMLRRALDALREQRTQRGLVLAVDDAHLLDSESLVFLINVVSSGVATVGLTARTGDPMASDLVDLWTNGVVERIDVGPLDRETARSAAEARLGPIDSVLEGELWRLAEGNLLVLHELIEGAVGRTLVEDDDGKWTRVAPLAESARLGDLVGSRLDALAEGPRSAMELIAVGAPLPSEAFGQVLGDAMVDLESRGLIARVDDVGRGSSIVPAHPLYGEILQANLDDGRLRSTKKRLVDVGRDVPGSLDSLRSAVWQRDSGEPIDSELALAGAAEALIRHDPGLAEDLVRPVGFEDDRSVLLLGRALSYQQRFDEAEDLFRRREAGLDLLGQIASVRAQNLAFGLGRIAEARDLLAEATDVVDDREMKARLNNERAMISAIRGDFVDATAASKTVLADESTGAVARAAAYATLTVALAMTGDCSSFDGIVEEAMVVADEARDHLPFALDQVEIMHMQSLLNAGSLHAAVQLAENHVSGDGSGGALRSTWLSACGLAFDLLGRHEQSAASAAAAVEAFAEADPFGLEAQARGLHAFQLAQMGSPTADEPVRGLELPTRAPRLSVWVDRGTAWARVARGSVGSAVETLIAGGRHAIEHEHYVWGAFCLHDVVRLGRPELVVADLRALPPMSGADLLEAMRAQSEALLAGDVAALAEVASSYADMGAALLAAETWAQAADSSAGSDQERASWALLSMVSERLCESPRTMALRRRPTLITKREAQVSADASTGSTSPEIAEKRFISVRTVDNHLSSVYRKLGIGGRDELRELLGILTGRGVRNE